MSQDGTIPIGTWKVSESELENRGQALILSGEIPTGVDLQLPSISSRMKPGESIWKPGEYLLESELMKFACEHRQVSGKNWTKIGLKSLGPNNCALI